MLLKHLHYIANVIVCTFSLCLFSDFIDCLLLHDIFHLHPIIPVSLVYILYTVYIQYKLHTVYSILQYREYTIYTRAPCSLRQFVCLVSLSPFPSPHDVFLAFCFRFPVLFLICTPAFWFGTLLLVCTLFSFCVWS